MGWSLGGAGLLLLLSALLLRLPVFAGSESGPGRIRVTTTTTMVTDLVKSVGGDRVEVEGLMGAGVDPHLYKAAASDITKQ